MSHRNSLLMKVKRGLRQLWTQDIWHLRPTAPFNWRYILPKQSTQIQLHRHLWWHSRYKLPGLLWLPLELLRWAYWRCWTASQCVEMAVAQYGVEVASRFGVPVVEQKRRLLYWAKTWCINPYTGYDWQLYRPEKNALAIVYENQTSAYHALRNRETGASKADHRLLGDKIALAEVLSANGIPMVKTAICSAGNWQDLMNALSTHSKLFCKHRSGNQAESAFAVWAGEHGLQGLAHSGANLPDETSVRDAWQILSTKDLVLIQPLLANHPSLAPASPSGVAITLRLVTRMQADNIAVWWAELQVPGNVSGVGGRGFLRIPVSAADGCLSAMNREWFLKQAWQDEYETHWQILSAMSHTPHWAQVCSYSLKAHRELPNVWAIAWDWVITPDGPILLEGNGGWGLSEVQQQGVDLQLSALQGSQSV